MKTLVILAVMAILGGNPTQYLKDRKQQRTIRTLECLGGMYKMDYKADYLLQEFIDADLTSQDTVKIESAAKLLNLPQKPAGGSPVTPACSAFQAVTEEGDIIYGRNFDFRFKDGANVMMRTSPKGGYKSVSMVSMNWMDLNGTQMTDGKTDLSRLITAPLMPMDGMNEKGLAVSVLMVVFNDCAQQYREGRHSIMTSVMMRMLLDRAANVDEALEMLSGYNFFANGTQKNRPQGNKINYHFLLSDRSGKTVVLEYVKEDGPEGTGNWVMNPVDAKFATNFFCTPGWYTQKLVDKRYLHIKEVLEAKAGVLSEQEAMQLLDEVHQTVTDKHQGKTQWSVVYNLTKGTARVCVNHDYSKMYEFSLKRFNK